jgi:hypothetical protein
MSPSRTSIPRLSSPLLCPPDLSTYFALAHQHTEYQQTVPLCFFCEHLSEDFRHGVFSVTYVFPQRLLREIVFP